MKARKKMKVRRDFKLDPNLDRELSRLQKVEKRTKTSIVEEAIKNYISQR